MASKITIKRSLTAAAPAGLSFGEMAFVQGSGNTAEQLYVGISGGNPVWVGARVENTVTDWDSKTRLATQFATVAKINSLITSNTAGVASFNGLTGAVNGITAGGINTFTQLNTFSAGISASGGVTFSKDITINSMTVGRGGNSNFYNVAVGSDVLSSNAQGNYNVAVGNDALKLNTSGSSNIAVGYAALSSNTTATENVAIGVSALGGATMGSSNVGVGYLALQNNSGSSNIGVGMGALSWNYGNSNVAVGASALTTPGANDSNVAVGASTLGIVTGANNTGIGAAAGYYRGSGEDNTLTSANNAIYIGYQARASADAQTNEIVIGVNAIGLGSNTAVIGATGQSAATIYGVLNLPSGLSTTGATFTGNISAPNIVTSFNGATGAATGVGSAVAGTGISVSGATGAVTITNIGVRTFNGLTGAVTGVSSFNGLTGAVSGLTSGGPLGTPSAGNLTNCTFPTLNQNTTGSAATLTTSRNINGTAFNGSQDITVTAAANTLTGATLASNVLASSLTSVGTLGSLSITGDLTVGGTFTVNGTVTTINSTTLTVDDKNIELGSVAVPDNTTANGGGISLLGATTKSIIWDSTNDNWTSSENWNIPTGKVFKINNASVLSSTTLGSAVVTSSLTTVGTITSGTWSGSFGAVSGANLTTLTAGNLSGTIPSGVLANSTVYIGTTAVALNRTTASLALTGISSIDGSAATVTTAAQPAITSVGTLTSLTVSGTLEAGLIDGGTF